MVGALLSLIWTFSQGLSVNMGPPILKWGDYCAVRTLPGAPGRWATVSYTLQSTQREVQLDYVEFKAATNSISNRLPYPSQLNSGRLERVHRVRPVVLSVRGM